MNYQICYSPSLFLPSGLIMNESVLLIHGVPLPEIAQSIKRYITGPVHYSIYSCFLLIPPRSLSVGVYMSGDTSIDHFSVENRYK